MKKILLLLGLVVLSAFPLIVYADPYIDGQSIIYENERVRYTVYEDYPNAQSVDWYYDTKKFDLISGGGSTDAYIELEAKSGSVGNTNIEATLNYSDYMISPRTVSYNILIMEHSQIIITGPFNIGPNQTVTYKLEKHELYDVFWVYDSEYFSLIGELNASLTVKSKNKTGKTHIGVNVYQKNTTNLADEIRYPVNISNLFKISTVSEIICTNNTTTYTLSGIGITIPSNTPITWQAGQNMTLVSGQGMTSATFKGSGNGYATVKAVVKHNEVDYLIENSQVWVGPPKGPSTIIFDKVEVDQLPNHTYYVPTERINAYTGAAYQWSLTKINPGGGLTPPDRPLEPFATKSSNTIGTYIIASTKDWVQLGFNSDPNLNARNALVYYYTQNQCGWSGAIAFNIPFYPNVTKSSATVNTFVPVSIQIYSFTSGELVYQDKKAVNFNINNTNIKKGIYIVKTTDAEGNVTQDKVMKTTD